MNRGIAYGLGAYFLWGILPVFWKLLHAVSPLEIVAHRTVWAFLLLLCVLAITGRGTSIVEALRGPRSLAPSVVTASLLAANSLIYIWAVHSGRIVETSLGYFINPLVNVLLGVIFLRERMRAWQWAAVGTAATGVLWLTLQYGALPWIGLTLAFSFGFYGLLKKLSGLDALEGLTAEMGILAGPMLVVLAYMYAQPGGAEMVTRPGIFGLLLATGALTVTPFLLFGGAAKRIPLSMLGLLQYIAPTMQFLLGTLVYREPFSTQLLIGFVLIWIALGIYTWEGLAHKRRRDMVEKQALSVNSPAAT